MIDFTVSKEIAAPVAHVFTYVTDPSKLHTWQETTVSVEQQDAGELGLGTKLREVHRGPGKRENESLVEVSRFERDKSFGLHMLEGPLLIDANLEFSEVAAGTRVDFRVFGQPTGGLRLIQPLLKGALKKQFSADLESLKSQLEGPR
ncbi:MAG: SRPBCC family protein [Solirubrobacterales bacterium]